MKKKWKALWARRPRLGRGGRTVRNLLLALALAALVWGQYRYPLPTAELEFRRMERRYLVGPGEMQGIFSVDGEQDQCVIGTEGDEAVLLLHPRKDPWFWPRGEGTTLVPRPWIFYSEKTLWVAAVDVPEGTASARLDLETRCWYAQDPDGALHRSAERDTPGGDRLPRYWEKHYDIPGELLEGGAVLFQFQMPDERDEKNFLEYTVLMDVSEWNTYRRDRKALSAEIEMEAVFYDAGGAELGRAALSTRKERTA